MSAWPSIALVMARWSFGAKSLTKYIVTAERLKIHRKRIPKLMTILDRLPAEFQHRLHDGPDNRIHRIFSLRTFHEIAQLETQDRMKDAMNSLNPFNR